MANIAKDAAVSNIFGVNLDICGDALVELS